MTQSNIQHPKSNIGEPYGALAAGYDFVMAHVDYAEWARYVHRLVQRHHPRTCDVLELGCGTGSLALALQPLGPYRYAATDGAPAMIRVARRKAEAAGAPIPFAVADFTCFEAEAPVDAVVLLYDGLNYLLEEAQVAALLRHVHAALRPGGVFIFDQSTPANSLGNADRFFDEGSRPGFSYVRESRYDAGARLHTTTFELSVEGARAVEEHVQRAYPLAVLRRLVAASAFETAACYHGRTLRPATDASERIHWVLRGGRGEG